MIEPANLRGTCCGLAHIRNAQTAVPDIGADPWTDSHLKRGVSRSRRHDSRNYIRISKEGGVVKSNGQTGRCLQATAGSSPQPRRSMTRRPMLVVGRLPACEVSYSAERRVKLQEVITPPDEHGRGSLSSQLRRSHHPASNARARPELSSCIGRCPWI